MTIDNWLTLVTIVILAIGTAIAFRQIVLLRRQLLSQYEWSRRVQALSYTLSRSERLSAGRVRLQNAFDKLTDRTKPLSLEEIQKASDENPEIHNDILNILSHWENMALAIHAKIVDEKVAFEMVAKMVISYVGVFRNFVHDRREKNPRAYDYLLTLASRWEDIVNGKVTPEFEALPFPIKR